MTAPPKHKNYYSLEAIRTSFVHFVLGRGFQAVSAFAVLIVAIRALATEEFAVYTSLHALVLMIGLLSSFGVNPMLLRYVPDLRVQGNNRAMYRLLFFGLAIRAASYGLVVLALLQFAEPIADLLKLGDLRWVLPWYLLVGFLRINATFTSTALESLLWQREAQYSTAAAGTLKLIAVLGVLAFGELDLRSFVAVEVLAEATSLMLLIVASWRRWRADEARHAGDAGVLFRDRRRYVRFAFWNYAQNLTSVLYGSAPNRLFAAYFLSPAALAVFGVVDRFVDYARRYEPSAIFIGMIRPIFNSRYRHAGDFPFLVSLGDLLYRLNLFVLLVPFVAFAVAGDLLFDWITAGKYTGATNLFLAFYAVCLLSSATTIIDILVKILEEARIFTVSNLALSGSIALAIPLIPYFGLWSLAIANGVGLLVSFAITLAYVGRRGFTIAPDWTLLAQLAAYTGVAVVAGRLVALWGPLPGLVVAVLVFLGLTASRPPLRAGERALLTGLLRGRKRPENATES